MLKFLIDCMFKPLKYVWLSHQLINLYKFIITPLTILWIPIGLVFAIFVILIVYPLVSLFFKLKTLYKRKKRKFKNRYKPM